MIYSSNDVVSMVNDGRLVVSDLPSRRLSKTQVVIEIQNRRSVAVLTMPHGYEQTGLLDTIMHSFTLPSYAVHVGITQKRSRNACIKALFAFLDTSLQRYSNISNKAQAEPIPVPPHSITDWLQHLKNHETPHTVWLYMTQLRKILTKSLENRYGKVSLWPADQKTTWQILIASTPKRPTQQKNPPLGRYLGIPSSKFTNHELFMGLRYGVLWLLQRLQTQRELFLREPTIAEEIENLRGKTLPDVESCFSYYLHWIPIQKSAITSNAHRFAAVSPAVWRCIQSDPLLREWQCYSWKPLRRALVSSKKGMATLFSAEQQMDLLARCVNADGSVRNLLNGKRTGRRVDHNWTPFKPYLGVACRVPMIMPCFWGADWCVHTQLERLLMVWLLASERAQKSGIKRLTFDGVHLSENAADLQISTRKLRRAAGDFRYKPGLTDVESPVYKRRSPPYNVYLNWLRLERTAQSLLCDYNSGRRMITGTESQFTGIIIGPSNSQITTANLPLKLLSIKGTVWQEMFLDETDSGAQREADAFIAILQNRVDYKRANPTLACKLPTDPIGQSLVIEQELEGNVDPEFSAATAEVMGHTETMGRIYKDGYGALNVSEIVEPVRAFARKVGDDKMALAEQLIQRLATSTHKVSLTEVETLCGIESTTVDQSELLSLLDENDKLTICGEISHNGEILIVETDLTAAMMWGYIQHLEAELPNLMLSDRDETSIRLLAKLIHLHQIFKCFSTRLQQAGKKLANSLRFPFPPLT